MSLQITIPCKESAPIQAHLIKNQTDVDVSKLVVFINGMMAPQAAWLPVIDLVKDNAQTRVDPSVAYLTYDRFGTGTTTHKDPKPADPVFGNDLNSIVSDLEAVIHQIAPSSSIPPSLVLVGNSIGCAVARHFAARNPGRVAGLLLLDSVLANSDFHDDIYPNPSSKDFDPSALPTGLSVEDLNKARELAFKFFSPTLPNPQGFDRRNMAQLLPDSDGPKLVGAGGSAGAKGQQPPKVIVVGHDPDKFKDDSVTRQGMPAASLGYVQSAWERYNEGLTKIGDCERGVVIAKGAGHFIQVDQPQFTAEVLGGLLAQVGWTK
ncbi:uncharacterized protein I303_106346 [Kwoniella dejecticola CBS 10117]|uniref:AB hydrolase-1 domain-containing protein n=1 Tax=Kwoniella dejecticola CBS 10117 TaxID=1296121 RepID=A0A1A5ZUY8_9TREE|nr:uncharacterized protein I303_08397 [Kwoniella dejecticola CBS 10117]OBR81626.1 hypothetical protein I303_08397 [Kwoniella dejecticola CBS 10117]